MGNQAKQVKRVLKEEFPTKEFTSIDFADKYNARYVDSITVRGVGNLFIRKFPHLVENVGSVLIGKSPYVVWKTKPEALQSEEGSA